MYITRSLRVLGLRIYQICILVPDGTVHIVTMVDIFQHMWRMGDIPQLLVWNVLVLIPKVSTDTRGILLLETLWKVIEALIDTRIHVSIHFHDAVHGFWSGRGTGTAVMELEITQELARVDHNPLLLVFLDLSKA